jgi:hypothetical protein
MTIYSFFRKWINDKIYSLKPKKPPCHPQSKEPLWTPQWTKPVKRDDPELFYKLDPNHSIMRSELAGNLNYRHKRYDD